MDSEFKKLLAGSKWADTGDRKDPDSGDISPELSRSIGFSNEYSRSTDGVTPDRRRINQIFRELYGAAFEVKKGVSDYDSEVNYEVGGMTKTEKLLWICVRDNGPKTTVVSPLTDGQTAWEKFLGSRKIPDAPHSFEFDNSVRNQMSVRWKNGLDGGELIDSYDFQWRIEENDNWSSSISLTYIGHTITGLSSGNRIQVRARARTTIGIGDWGTSEISDDSEVTGSVPVGGNVFGLIAEAGDARATLRWSIPDDGGFPILRYRIQYRTDDQTFGNVRETTIAGSTTTVITGLTNGKKHYFQVRAENIDGPGEWSNIAFATPPSVDSSDGATDPFRPFGFSVEFLFHRECEMVERRGKPDFEPDFGELADASREFGELVGFVVYRTHRISV